MKWCPTDESLTCVDRRFRQYPLGLVGQASLHYGAAQDCDYPGAIVHGTLSDENTPVSKMMYCDVYFNLYISLNVSNQNC